jgi:hypothetical protein
LGNCARCNSRAGELNPKPENPAWWNLGIAATALRDWDLARQAWISYGVRLPAGDGPIQADFGWAPVRIDPEGEPEVVWGRRIDPARVVIENIPFPESGHRHGDVVLHDGDPRGEREVDGRTYPVFNEIELWQASGIPTVVGELMCPEESDARAALDTCEAAGLKAEDWSGSVRILCRACSEGRPHRRHDSSGPPGWQQRRSFGFAAEAQAVRAVLEKWQARGHGRVASVFED